MQINIEKHLVKTFINIIKNFNRLWKVSKTAWNPTVHVNNVFGNIFFTDMGDVDFRNWKR